MPGKRPPANSIISSKKRQKTVPTVEEITFDISAREDYLTGFHKRKLQRIKHAKEEASKKEREEKIKARKILREQRRVDLEKHVQDVNSMIRKAAENEDSDEEGDKDNAISLNSIEDTHEVDRHEEYIDEDRYTTVTVEAVDITRDGLRTITKGDKQDNQDITMHQPDSSISKKNGGGEAQNGKRIWTKERPKGPKKKKKKFKYESKAERKVTRYKEKSGNKLKAKARKE